MVCSLVNPHAKGDAISLHRWLYQSTFEEALTAVGGEGEEGDPIMHYLTSSDGVGNKDTELEAALLLVHVLRHGLLDAQEVDEALLGEDVLVGLKKRLDKRAQSD